MPSWPIEMPSETEMVPNSSRVTACRVHPVLDRLGQPVQGEIARSDLVPTGGDADLRLGPVLIGHTDGAQHATGSGGFQAVGDHSGTGLDVDAVAGCRVGSLGGDALLSHGGQSSCSASGERLDPVCWPGIRERRRGPA